MKGGFNIKKILLVVVCLLLLTVLFFNNSNKIIIPKQAIRFRVIANSNSVEDQNIKIQVRDDLQKEMISLLKDSNSIDESRLIIKDNVFKFTKTVENTLNRINSNQKVKINYGKNYFPQKNYRGVTYNEGKYESLVVTLGKGAGDNWWCVLFPPLCLLEAEENNTAKVEYKFFVKELIDKYFK